MDSTSERARRSSDCKASQNQIDRLIASIDANTHAMKLLMIALLNQDEQANDDESPATYLDGTPK